MYRRHSQKHQADCLGQRRAAGRVGLGGLHRVHAGVARCKNSATELAPRLDENEVEVEVEVRLTDFGGCRLNTAQGQSWQTNLGRRTQSKNFELC